MSTVIPNFKTIRIDHPKLRKFAPLVCAGSQPIKVAMSSKQRAAGCCYWNVAEEVRTNGGVAVYGWQIVYWPKRFMEAMHHAIWRMPNGTLLDVTEKYSSDSVESYSVFIIDDSIPIDLDKPNYVQSKHFAFKNDPNVTSFITAYRNKNVAEIAMASLLYKYGYRNEGPKARAKGVSLDPSFFKFPPEFHAESASIGNALNKAMNQLGSAINLIHAADKASTST